MEVYTECNSMNRALKRQLRGFNSSTLCNSRHVNVEVLDNWLEREHPSTRSVKLEAAQSLSAHSGPRTPLPYQLEVLGGAEKVLDTGAGCLISLPTGAGKTFTAIQLVMRSLPRGVRRVLWLAPQKLLLLQAESELRRSWWTDAQSTPLYIAQSHEDFRHARNDLAVVHFSTLQGLLDRKLEVNLDLIVVDEAHHLHANEFGRVVRSNRTKNTLTVGLSATPGRGRAAEFDDLAQHFDHTLVTPDSLGKHPVRHLRSLGVYAHLQHETLNPTMQSDVELAFSRGRKLSNKPAICALSAGRLDAIIERVLDCGAGDRILVFAYSLAHCHVIAAGLFAKGVAVAVVGSQQSDEQNEAAVASFKNGKIRCLVNVKFVAVGADFPNANVAILSVPLGSAVMFEQVVGRIARGPAVGGTVESTLVDFDNHFRMHEAIQSYARFAELW